MGKDRHKRIVAFRIRFQDPLRFSVIEINMLRIVEKFHALLFSVSVTEFLRAPFILVIWIFPSGIEGDRICQNHRVTGTEVVDHFVDHPVGHLRDPAVDLIDTVTVKSDRLHFGINVPKEKHLRITIPEDLEYSGIFDEPFKTYTNYARLERVKTINLGTMYELTYVVDLKDPSKEKEFIDALRCRNGNLTVIVTSVLRNKDDL